MVPGESSQSRADVQAQLRKERKKAERHRHRWRRRVLWGLSVIIFLTAAGAGGIYVYINYNFDRIHKVHAQHLTAPAPPGKPFNILLVGSDSRSFVQNATQVKAFGSSTVEGGQRSDVTMVARFVPATKSVTVLSIPRDLWVDIPGNGNIQGPNRINAAYDVGPDLLIQTIEQDLNIPINHYVSINFNGFQSMVDALGGITMDFPTPVKDSYSGLNVSTIGCQLVPGTTALELVRARHLQYKNANGYWEYDGLSDFSRIQRQDSFFRAVLAKLNTSISITNVLSVNSFINAAVGNMTIDDTLSRGDIFGLAKDFKGLPSSHLVTETLPTTGYVTDGGADVLKEAQPYAQDMIDAFNLIGTPAALPVTAKGHAGTTTTVPTEAHSSVDVNVMNASSVSGIAHSTASRAHRPGLQGCPDRRRVVAPRRRRALGDPLRSFGLRGGAHLGLGAERPGHLRGRLEPERPDGHPPRRRVRALRDRCLRCGHDHDDGTRRVDDHDDDPVGRLHEHPARALEPLPLLHGPVDAGVAEHDDHPYGALVAPARDAAVCAGRCAQADLRRCRTIRLRSRSVVPPQIPSRSRWARACSRHA